MSDSDWQVEQFEQHRPHLRAVAYRMLGSMSEADDALQEAWLRLSRSDTARGRQPARLADDRRRARVPRRAARAPGAPRGLRRHLAAGARSCVPTTRPTPSRKRCSPTRSGSRCFVVLETLSPPERLAFVLHDMFAVPFDEIAPIVGQVTGGGAPAREPRAAPRAGRGARRGRRPAAAARGRRRISRCVARPATSSALVAVLDPDVVFRIDARRGQPTRTPAGQRCGRRRASRSSRADARSHLMPGRRSSTVRRESSSEPDVDPFAVGGFTVARGRIVEIDLIIDPEKLRGIVFVS